MKTIKDKHSKENEKGKMEKLEFPFQSNLILSIKVAGVKGLVNEIREKNKPKIKSPDFRFFLSFNFLLLHNELI